MIDEMKYADTAQKHIDTVVQQKNDPSTVLGICFSKGMTQSPLAPHNSNGSTETLLELNEIIKRQIEATEDERKFTLQMDDLKNHYSMWAEEASKVSGKKYDYEYVEKIATCADGYVNYIKLLHARPRPFQIAPLYEKKVTMIINDPRTGSYPSGHSYDAWLFAMIFTMKHPEHRNHFSRIADRISTSRMIAGVHFPSDLVAGKKLAIHALNVMIENSLLKGIV